MNSHLKVVISVKDPQSYYRTPVSTWPISSNPCLPVRRQAWLGQRNLLEKGEGITLSSPLILKQLDTLLPIHLLDCWLGFMRNLSSGRMIMRGLKMKVRHSRWVCSRLFPKLIVVFQCLEQFFNGFRYIGSREQGLLHLSGSTTKQPWTRILWTFRGRPFLLDIHFSQRNSDKSLARQSYRTTESQTFPHLMSSLFCCNF